MAAKKAAKKKSAKKKAAPVAPSGLVNDVKAAIVKHGWSGSIVAAAALEPAGVNCGPGERPMTITFMKDGHEVTTTVCVPF